MNKRNRLIVAGDNLLFVLNGCIIFLLLFADKIVVPAWLQPLGRMHPMLLHFPIVLLLLAMGMEFFRSAHRSFTTNLLLAGNIFAALTIIMGLLLATEEGYEGSVLQWHKWSGIGILFFSSLVYWCHNARWYKAPLAKVGALITVCFLLLAGHYGATLTHGHNFILASLNDEGPETIPPEEALVFDHLVKPLLEKKCTSCHNPQKLKGELLLTDSAAIMKGGKSGKLFKPGDPSLSLLLQRIHLPLEDKKHMPPAGKAQLTGTEQEFLYWWIKNNTPFHQRVNSLPADDSLRLVATALLQPGGNAEEEFAFEAADPQLVNRLDNNYRVVNALTTASPALTVNFYNSNQYSKKSLEELEPLKTQIISLNLNKMPVKDEELSVVAKFVNLRHLNLNFSDITGPGLTKLTALQNLVSLSVSGCSLRLQDLQTAGKIKSLRKLIAWETGLSDEQLQQVRSANPQLELVTGFKDDGTPMKLTAPQQANASAIFSDSLSLLLKHSIRGVSIRYTTDGSIPDSIHSPEFKTGITLYDSATISTRAFKNGWVSSDVAVYEFFRSRRQPDTSYFLVAPHDRHRGNGTTTFFDGELADITNRYSTRFLGFRGDRLSVVLEYKKAVEVNSVVLHGLHSPGQLVFPPESLEIWGGNEKDNLNRLATFKPQQPSKMVSPAMGKVECRFKPRTVKYLKIIAKPVMKMPAWSPAKEKPALMLVDELFIN